MTLISLFAPLTFCLWTGSDTQEKLLMQVKTQPFEGRMHLGVLSVTENDLEPQPEGRGEKCRSRASGSLSQGVRGHISFCGHRNKLP